MRRTSYLKRASRRFLEGTRFKAPVEAVEAGARSLTEWAEMLAEEREAENEYLRQRSMNRRMALEERRIRRQSLRSISF
jgi:hypothetical protein